MTTVDSVWVKQLHVYGTGNTSVQGEEGAAEALTGVRVDFSINDIYDNLYFPEPVTMMYQIDFDLTDGGNIQLWKMTSTWARDELLVSFSGPETGNSGDTLELGAYQIWVQSSGNGSFDIDFKVSAVPIPPAIWFLGSGIVGLVGVRRKFRKI
jgi:hypothetical protein